MKAHKLVLLALVPLMTFAQSETFSIKGKMGNLNAPSKIYLVYRQGEKQVTDTAIVKNGIFEFKGKVVSSTKARLVADHKGAGVIKSQNRDFIDLYLEKADITATSPDSAFRTKFSGSVATAEYRKYSELTSPIQQKKKQLMSEYYAASDEKKASTEFKKELEGRSMAFEKELKQLETDFIKSNPNSFATLDLVKSSGGSVPDVEALEQLFNGLTERIRISASGKELAAQIMKLKTVVVGATAPDFTQLNPDNKAIKLSDFKGKYVLLDFWASWCGPCRAENPQVVSAYNQFKDKNFTVFGVSLDDEKGREAWLKAIEKDKLNWEQVSDLKGWKNEVAQLYCVKSVPQNFLIDPSGKIIARNLRGEKLMEKLSEVFGK